VLTQQHYRELGHILGAASNNPAQNINRHYFLAMETPLGLIQKITPPRWDEIILTPAGLQLATASDTPSVFEMILRDIRFCKAPWYTSGRREKYSDFDVAPYSVSVMDRNEGYLDINEFDLFVSRIRSSTEVQPASDYVGEFRRLTGPQKQQLLYEVESRIPGRKEYSNWRDSARHTFSLLSLGQNAIRAGNELTSLGF